MLPQDATHWPCWHSAGLLAPPVHVSGQSPQVPPQPSEPHALVLQSGVHVVPVVPVSPPVTPEPSTGVFPSPAGLSLESPQPARASTQAAITAVPDLMFMRRLYMNRAAVTCRGGSKPPR